MAVSQHLPRDGHKKHKLVEPKRGTTTFTEKYGRATVLTRSNSQSIGGMPAADSGAFDFMRTSPDSASTGMGTSFQVVSGSGGPVERRKSIHLYQLKPQTPYIEESDSMSDTTDIQIDMLASKRDRGGSQPVDPNPESGADCIDFAEFKDKIARRIEAILEHKDEQVMRRGQSVKRHQRPFFHQPPRSKIPKPRPPGSIRDLADSPPTNESDLGSSYRSTSKLKAATMCVTRNFEEEYPVLHPSKSEKLPKGEGVNKMVQAETLELGPKHLQFHSEAMIPQAADPTSLASATLERTSRVDLRLPMINGDDVWKVNDEVLGRGVSGSVHLCRWIGVEVAVKEWHELSNEGNFSSMQQEAETLGSLRHPCVVQIFGSSCIGGSPATVMEYVVHGSLKSKLVGLKDQGGLTTNQKVALALRVAYGMQFLHSQNIIHFDLKSANLLCDLRDTTRPVVKIADVGLSKMKLSSFVSGNMRGTLPWMAPELFPSLDSMPDVPGVLLDKVNEKVDVYSYAIVLWEIWTLGDDPYKGLTMADILYGLMSRTLRPEVPSSCESFWGNLMLKCWLQNPADRPGFEEIVRELEAHLDVDTIMV